MHDEVVEGFALSPQQRRLWLLQQGAGGEVRRSEAAALVAAPLDEERLRAAVAGAIARHEILRTTFRSLPGMTFPVQVVHERSAPQVEVRAVFPEGAVREAAEAALAELSAPPFDLAAGPLLRLSLTPLPGASLLCASLPALVADAAGAGNLLRELCRAAAEEGAGSEPEPEPAVQYADVSQFLCDLLDSEETEEGREYWHGFAADGWGAGLPPFPAPAADAGPVTAARQGVAPLVPLDREERSVALAAACGTSEEAVWLACWAVLLARLGDRAELTLGVGFDGRGYAGLETVPGPFARFLPVLCRIDERETFQSLVARLGGDLARAAERQDYFRWEDLGADVRFAVGFELGAPLDPPALGEGAAGALFERRAVLEPFDLAFAGAREAGGGVRAELRFAGSALCGDNAARLARCFAALAASALAAPGAAVGDLEALSAGDRRELLASFDTSAVALPLADRCLHELYEEQAERTPRSPALTFTGGELDYAGLEARANQLAHRLQRLGVGPEVRVGICLERSPEMVVALLGVLKAGGAYVPLDPSYPWERLAWMAEDSALSLVLTAGTALAAWEPAARQDLRVLRLDADPELAAQPTERPAPAADADGLAYVIYTSGSTGRPKGVLVSHRAIANRLLWMRAAFPFGADDAVLQKTPLSFDASIWEIFVPLLTGGRVVLALPGGQRDAAYLLRAVREHRVTVLQLVPSHLGVLAAEEGFEACRGLRRLFCGGEALPVELARRVRDRLGVELCNLYGPTETAIDATFWPVVGELEGAVVPIGRPIGNLGVHLLDRRLRLVPVGLPGELYVAGAGLARGYHGRPDLTAERFVPDPFASAAGGRLYRTGDLARRRQDEVLEFLGRADDQVKVRGFRIEPGEIAAVLASHPAVREAAVVARPGPGGQPRLVGYAATAADAGPRRTLLSDLRELLRERLPEHMVPADLVLLDALPRLPNGKLDSAALPAPDPTRPELEADFVPPRTVEEEVLAGILADALGLERVSARASYLGLGGHSLLATQVVSRIREAFQVELPLRSLFETPVVADLAAAIAAAARAGRGPDAPPLAPVPRGGELPLSFAQQRLWFLHQLQPASPLFNISTALHASGRLDAGALLRALREILRRHEGLRATFPDAGGRPVQRILPPDLAGFPRGLPLVDLAGLPAEQREPEVLRLATAEGRRPFDLRRGPLVRVALLALAPEQNVILFTMHHIAGDGWSTGVLVRELSALYGAFAHGLPSPLPELPVQYADYASWQRRWLAGEVLDRQLAYWQRQLAGSPPTLRLATDRPRPAVQSGRGARMAFAWPAELLTGARALARRGRATLFMVLMAGFQALLHLRTGQDDLVVGTDIANRNRVETEGLIGFFVNQLALRARFTPGLAFQELLAQVRETTLEAYAHQDLSFDKLVEVLRPERSAEHAPLFQVKLNFQNVPPLVLDLEGLTLSRLAVQRGTSQLDMILNLEEGDAGLRGSLEHSTDLWNTATMVGLLDDFQLLLSACAYRRELTLEEARPLLADAARRREEAQARDFAALSRQKLQQRVRRGAAPAAAV